MPTATRTVGPARRGKRVELADTRNTPPAPDAAAPGQVYVTVKPMMFGAHTLPPGTEVPNAASWRRLDAWLGQRRVRLAGPEEPYLTYEAFLASVESASSPTPTASPGQEGLGTTIAADVTPGPEDLGADDSIVAEIKDQIDQRD